LARDNKICASALRYTGQGRTKLAVPEQPCGETNYSFGFPSSGFLVYAFSLCGLFFGFDDELHSPMKTLDVADQSANSEMSLRLQREATVNVNVSLREPWR
jgi:hypothetical protein